MQSNRSLSTADCNFVFETQEIVLSLITKISYYYFRRVCSEVLHH